MTEKLLTIIIPVRNKDLLRIKRCISFLKLASRGYEEHIRILVVDYGSENIICSKDIYDTTVLRLDASEWNKSHLLNYTIKGIKAQYIMTLDVDMLISKEIFQEIMKPLLYYPKGYNCFIVDTNVRRIQLKDYSTDYKKMVTKSLPWNKENKGQYFSPAVGGIQVFSKKFWEEVGGFPESLGKFWGCEDSFMFVVARIRNLNIIDISFPLLHMNHKTPNETILNQGQDKKIIMEYINYKSNWLDWICRQKITKNPESYIAREKPCLELYNKFLNELKERPKVIQKAISEGKENIEYMYEGYKLEKQKPSILISVINNYENMPTNFTWDLIKLYNHTKLFYPSTDLQQVNACDVATMRNLSVQFALGDNPMKRKYNYLVMLDVDHHYPQDFIVRFLDLMEKNKWEVLTGLTDNHKVSKDGKHHTTQFIKIPKDLTKLNEISNSIICPKPINKQVKIEASGVVGMVINTKIFEKLEFPYFFVRYELPTEKIPQFTQVSEDVWFSEKLKEQKIPIMLDLKTSFPHLTFSYLDRGILKE